MSIGPLPVSGQVVFSGDFTEYRRISLKIHEISTGLQFLFSLIYVQIFSYPPFGALTKQFHLFSYLIEQQI